MAGNCGGNAESNRRCSADFILRQLVSIREYYKKKKRLPNGQSYEGMKVEGDKERG